MENNYKTKNHHKYLLQYHLIFVVKYRRTLFNVKQIDEDIKQLLFEICNKHNVEIKYMETDQDHCHMMISTDPTVCLSDLVRTMKSYSTYHIWEYHIDILKNFFWKEKTFWSDGYFISSIGEVSSDTLKHYIENQGKNT